MFGNKRDVQITGGAELMEDIQYSGIKIKVGGSDPMGAAKAIISEISKLTDDIDGLEVQNSISPIYSKGDYSTKALGMMAFEGAIITLVFIGVSGHILNRIIDLADKALDQNKDVEFKAELTPAQLKAKLKVTNNKDT